MDEKPKIKWSEKDIQILKEYWPHWGTEKAASILQLTELQVKSKADKLRLTMLPKNQRRCICCNTKYQSSRRYGLSCRDCYLENRKEMRKLYKKPMRMWITELLRSLKYRSIDECDLTVDYMMSLWNEQDGKCMYTSFDMREPCFYGLGRSYYSASVDRIDSNRGYIKGNIVWCCFGANLAKSDFDLDEFINNCGTIYNNKENIKRSISIISVMD